MAGRGSETSRPADIDGLRELVASLSPAERLELRALLDHPDGDGRRDGEPTSNRFVVLERPRLDAVLERRFEVAAITVVAPAGFGKSTLLAQAIADPRVGGIDVHVAVRRGDDATSLLSRIESTLRSARGLPPSTSQATTSDVVNLMWAFAPDQVCVIVDDMHRLDDLQARSLLDPLVHQLPDNGHLVVASRRDLDVPLERLRVEGSVLSLDEADLAFTDDEIARFLHSRGAGTDRIADTRWPALLELACHRGDGSAQQYVREEIVSALEPERRAALCRLSLIGAFDDELVAAVTSCAGSAVDLVHGLPLVVIHDGEVVLHDLWLELLRPLATAEERDAAVSAAIAILRGRGDLERAWTLALTTAHDEGLVAIARDLALDFASTTAVSAGAELLRRAPPHLFDRVEVLALRSAISFGIDPVAAPTPLREVLVRAAAAGDVEVQLVTWLRLAELAFRSAGFEELAEIERAIERAGADDDRRAAVLAIVRGWHALMHRQYALAESSFTQPVIAAYHPVVELAQWYSCCWLGWVGESRRALDRVGSLERRPSGRFASRIQGYIAIQRWLLGELTTADRARLRSVVDDLEQRGERHLFIEAAAVVATIHASAGDLGQARELLEMARRASGSLGEHHWGTVALAQAEAAVRLLDGDEAGAAEALGLTEPGGATAPGATAHLEWLVVGLTYALRPASRDRCDRAPFGPELDLGREVGRALVVGRAGNLEPARRLPWQQPHRLRPFAFEPHLLELAVMAVAAGEQRAAACLADLRVDPDRHMSALFEHPVPAVRATAQRLSRTVPRRPADILSIGVLGPPLVGVGGRCIKLSPRSRDLLALLVHDRRVARRAAIDHIWPDKSARDGANNLRVTLAQLIRSLEPDGAPHRPAWHVRSDGDDLVLVAGELLSVDRDEFDAAIRAARAAEAAGRPDEALEQLIAACECYRGDYLDGWTSLELGYLESMHLRAQYVRAATRAAELLNARGRFDEARDLATRAADREPLDPAVIAALVSAYLGLDHRDGAAEILRRHLTELRMNDLELPAELRLLANSSGLSI